MATNSDDTGIPKAPPPPQGSNVPKAPPLAPPPPIVPNIPKAPPPPSTPLQPPSTPGGLKKPTSDDLAEGIKKMQEKAAAKKAAAEQPPPSTPLQPSSTAPQSMSIKGETIPPKLESPEGIIKGAAQYAAIMSLSYERALMEVQIRHDVAQIGRSENADGSMNVDNSKSVLEKRKKAHKAQTAEMEGYFGSKAVQEERTKDFQNAISGKITEAFKGLEEQWETNPVVEGEKQGIREKVAREIAEAEVNKRYPKDKPDTPSEERLPGAVQYAYNPTDLAPAMMYLNEAEKRVPIVDRVKADIENERVEGVAELFNEEEAEKTPTISVSADEEEPEPTISLEGEEEDDELDKSATVSVEAPSSETTVKATPAKGKDQELASDKTEETEKKSLMAEAEVAGGKSWEEALDKFFDSAFGKIGEATKLATGIALGAIGTGLGIVTGGNFGGSFLKASGNVLNSMSAVQEYGNRIVEVPKEKAPTQQPDGEAPKPPGEGGELAPRMNEAQRKLEAGQQQELGDDHPETRHLEAMAEGNAETNAEMVERLDAEKAAVQQQQPASQPDPGAMLEADTNSSNKPAPSKKGGGGR